MQNKEVLVLNRIPTIFKAIGSFLLNYVDYLIFLVLLIFKLNLFADLSGTVFASHGILGYFSEVWNWMQLRDDETLRTLREGVTMVSVGSVFLVSFWVFSLPRRGRMVALLVLNGLLSVLIFADMVYFRYFEDLISVAVMLQAGQVGAVGDSIVSLLSMADWLFFLDLFLFIPLVILIYKKVPRVRLTRNGLIARVVNTFVAFTIGFVLVFYPIDYFIDKGGSYLFEKTISNMRVYEKTGLLGFHGFDVYKNVKEKLFGGQKLTAKEKAELKEWFSGRRDSVAGGTEFTGIAEGKNVIVLQLEAFENFLIDKEVDRQEITPNLNRLKRESMYFPNFFFQTASGRTSDAEFLVNTSLYPMYTGSAFISYSGNSYTAMPELLRDNGYGTSVFHAYQKSFWNRYLMYPSLGIDSFYSLEQYEMIESLGWSISDESFLMQSFEVLKDLEQPFYTMLITLTSHHPYDIPDEYKELEIQSLKNVMFTDYLQSAHYVDKALGKFIDLLKGTDLWENSVIVVYGDHDSGLLASEGEVAEFVGVAGQPYLFNEVRKEVPLLIHLPGGDGAGVYEQVSGQIDLAPTTLDLVGVKLGEGEAYMMGTSLFSEADKMVVFRTGSFVADEVLYSASVDRVFEKGICYERATGEEVDLGVCEPLYEKAIKQLEISDAVLNGNLIREWK